VVSTTQVDTDENDAHGDEGGDEVVVHMSNLSYVEGSCQALQANLYYRVAIGSVLDLRHEDLTLRDAEVAHSERGSGGGLLHTTEGNLTDETAGELSDDFHISIMGGRGGDVKP